MENMKYPPCFLDDGQAVIFQMKYKKSSKTSLSQAVGILNFC